MATQIQLLESGEHCTSLSVGSLTVGLDKERSLQNKGGYNRRRACLHFGCCCPHKDSEYQLRLAKHDLRARFVKCAEDDGGIFGHVLRTVTNFSFLC